MTAKKSERVECEVGRNFRAPPMFLGAFNTRHNEICEICADPYVLSCAWIWRGSIVVLYLCVDHCYDAAESPFGEVTFIGWWDRLKMNPHWKSPSRTTTNSVALSETP